MPGSFVDDDLTACFVSTEFAETVIVNGVSILAVFDDEDVEVTEDGSNSATILRQPSILCRESLLPNIARNQVVTVRGVNYFVMNWKAEGDGTMTVYLGDP